MTKFASLERQGPRGVCVGAMDAEYTFFVQRTRHHISLVQRNVRLWLEERSCAPTFFVDPAVLLASVRIHDESKFTPEEAPGYILLTELWRQKLAGIDVDTKVKRVRPRDGEALTACGRAATLRNEP